jgi:hypothetical protein
MVKSTIVPLNKKQARAAANKKKQVKIVKKPTSINYQFKIILLFFNNTLIFKKLQCCFM